MNTIHKYFPGLEKDRIEKFSQLFSIYREWNSKINLISRKDFDNFYLHHVLHSLGIAKVCRFDSGARIMDVGCGGGFPGIPLAIMFPEAEFLLVDSIGKKIKVVEDVAEQLDLENVRALHGRAENATGKFDYIVSRAVTDMPTFLPWVWGKVEKGCKGDLPNGILYLKGGDLAQELAATGRKWSIYSLSNFFEEEFFETKKVIYLPK